MITGSPKNAARLQKSMVWRTAGLCATMESCLLSRPASRFASMSSCRPAVSISPTCERSRSSASDLIPVYQQLGFEYAESNPELELNGKVQAQWEYFKTEQHKRRRAYKKSIL